MEVTPTQKRQLRISTDRQDKWIIIYDEREFLFLMFVFHVMNFLPRLSSRWKSLYKL